MGKRTTGRRRSSTSGSVARGVGLCLGLWCAGVTSETRAGGFSDQLQGNLAALGRALGETVALAVPLVSASAPFRYAFDPHTNVFERLPETSGQVLVETPYVIGAERSNMSVSYAYVGFDEINGMDLSHLSGTLRVPFGRQRPTAKLQVDQDVHLDLNVQETVFAFSYGLTDTIEVNATVPVVYSSFHIGGRIDATILAPDGNPGVRFKPTDIPSQTHTAAGVGDLVLRGKWLVLDGNVPTAFRFGVRLPTGDPDNFQGTGDVALIPGLLASTRYFRLASMLAVAGNVTGGLDADVETFDRSQAQWAAGVDAALGDRVGLAVSVLGRHALDSHDVAPGLQCPRTLSAGSRCVDLLQQLAAQDVDLGLIGVSVGRPDVFDLSIGGRIRVWSDVARLFFNVLIPLNTDGVRAQVVPLAGFEMTF